MSITRAQPLLAIVPARGGSKGVPHKNMRFLGDRPLLAHTLEAIAEAEVASRLIVSSDSEQILTWADLHGLECHEREAELASDEATISDVSPPPTGCARAACRRRSRP